MRQSGVVFTDPEYVIEQQLRTKVSLAEQQRLNVIGLEFAAAIQLLTQEDEAGACAQAACGPLRTNRRQVALERLIGVG